MIFTPGLERKWHDFNIKNKDKLTIEVLWVNYDELEVYLKNMVIEHGMELWIIYIKVLKIAEVRKES